MERFTKSMLIIFLILGVGFLVGCLVVFIGGHSNLKPAFVVLSFIGLAFIYVSIGALVNIHRGNFEYSFSWFGSGGFNVKEASGVANIFYYPAEETEEQFLKEVALHSARKMDKIGRNKHINQINVWAVGQISLEGQKIVKRVNLTLNKENWKGPAIGGLLNFATSDQQSYLKLCSLKDVNEGEIPEWEKPRAFPG